MSVREKVEAVRNGTLSSEKLCEEAIARIGENDKQGKGLNAVSAINPDWREEARALDEDPSKASSSKSLYGIPVLVKDNIEVKGMANPAGSYVLRDLIAKDDAFIVKRLKDAGDRKSVG